MKDFIQPRQQFWTLLRESWDEVFKGEAPFVEKNVKPPRYAKIMEIEEVYLRQDLSKPAVRAKAREEILRVISEYREPGSKAVANAGTAR